MGVGEAGFVGERLTEVREARGLNQTDLAVQLGVQRGSISNYERGKRSPEEDMLTRLSNVLVVPEAFFFRPVGPVAEDVLFYRSLASATKTDRRRAQRRFGWLKQITGYLRGFVRFPRANLPQLNPPGELGDFDLETISRYADRTREFWGLGKGPISDMMLLLENKGVIVSKALFNTRHMDAYSSLDQDSATPYVIVAYDKGSAVRSRFDLAHELGHLVLHRRLRPNVVGNPANNRTLEAQANMFAGEFLLPGDAFAQDMGVVSLDALKSLKRRWRVSIGAMLHRLSDLGWVSAEQSTRLWVNYSRRGWRRQEPFDDELEQETPRLLRRGFELLVQRRIRRPSDFVSDICLSPKDISELAGLSSTFFYSPSDGGLMVAYRGNPDDVGATEEYGLDRHYIPRSFN